MYNSLHPNSTSHSRRSLVQSLLGDELPLGPSKSDCNTNTVEWTWDVPNGDDYVELLNNDRDVTFHRKHSSGTAVVRGTTPMSRDQHFWEIEMISPVYGTDMMVGIGTPEADMSQLPNTFISRLGKDVHTWGFSYTGSFYHNGKERILSTAFDQGSIIGLHLDMWNGTLAFYKNKKYLGIASKGLKGKTLYAMASSTAACSSMSILQSCSFPSSLQFLCCVKLRNLIPDDKSVLDEINVPPGLKLFLKNNLSWLLNPRLIEEHPFNDQYHQRTRVLSRPCIVTDAPTFYEIMQSPERMYNEQFGLLSGDSVNFFMVDTQNGQNSFYNHYEFDIQDDEERQPEANGESGENVVEEESNEDSNDIPQNDAKRCKYESYNYAVGLSDPDSDTEL